MNTRYLVALLLVVSCAASVSAVDDTALQKGIGATVLIRATKTVGVHSGTVNGTGFFLSDRGVVLTNWHIVAGRSSTAAEPAEVAVRVSSIEVVVGAGTSAELTLAAQVVASDRENDLALLRVRHKPQAWLELSPEPAKLTQALWAIGFPFGEDLAAGTRSPEPTVSTGHVTSLRHDDSGQEVAIQTDVALNPGNSGGPLLDESGRVVGVIWAGLTRADSTNFALPLQKVNAFLAANRVTVRVEPTDRGDGSSSVKVRVQSIMGNLAGATGRATLGGTSSPAQAELRPEGEELIATLTVGACVADLAARRSVVKVDLKGADGNELAKREVRLDAYAPPAAPTPQKAVTPTRGPVISGGSLTSATSSRGGALGRAKAESPGKSPDSLQSLASSVKLKGSGDGEVRVTDSNVDSCVQELVDEHYTAIKDEKLRGKAIRYDYLDCTFGKWKAEYYTLRSLGRTRYVSLGGDLNPSNPYADLDVKIRNSPLGDALELLADYVNTTRSILQKAGACRCSDGSWRLPAETPGCTSCSLPPPPEVPE